MIKTVLVILVLSSGLSANYTQAYQLYLDGHYAKTIKELKKSKKEYSNPNLHLLWGHSAKQLGNLNEAMSAYERVLLLTPSNTEAKDALEKIYKQTDREALLDPSAGLTSFKTYLSVAAGYDNNLNAAPNNKILQEYFKDTSDMNSTASSLAQVSTSLTYTDDLGEKNGWYSKYVLRGFMQHHFSESFYNLNTVSLEAGIGHNTQRYNVYMPISYHRVNYLGEDLLSQYRFHPSLFVPIGKNNLFNLNIIYSKNKYISKENKIKNDSTIAVEVGNYFLFNEDFISMHLKYEQHSDIQTLSAKYVSAKFWALKLGSKYTFTPKISALVNYSFRYGQYDDKVGVTNTSRDDNFHQLDLKLRYQWSKTSSIFLLDTYNNNKSNYPAVDYDKNTILLGVEFRY